MTAQQTQRGETEVAVMLRTDDIRLNDLGESAYDDAGWDEIDENTAADWPVEVELEARQPNTSYPSSRTESDQNELLTLDDLVPSEITFDAALLFVGDQILYRYRDDGSGWRMKFISPASVRAAFDELPIDSGWLPSPVRRHGLHPKGHWAVMYIPPGRHTIQVQANESKIDLSIPLPGLVFAGWGANYYLFAIATSEFSSEAELFYAPLSNINGNGLICFGSNLLAPCSVTTLGQMWNLFIASAFTAHHVDHRCQSYPNNILQLLCRLARKRKFPIAELLPAYMSVDQWIDRLLRHT